MDCGKRRSTCIWSSPLLANETISQDKISCGFTLEKGFTSRNLQNFKRTSKVQSTAAQLVHKYKNIILEYRLDAGAHRPREIKARWAKGNQGLVVWGWGRGGRWKATNPPCRRHFHLASPAKFIRVKERTCDESFLIWIKKHQRQLGGCSFVCEKAMTNYDKPSFVLKMSDRLSKRG